jgi:hypothetical protein
LQALANLQAGGTGFAVDKDFFHGLIVGNQCKWCAQGGAARAA